MTDAQHITDAFATLLQPARFKDYGPNGLQVQGSPSVQTLVSGVTASKALIEAALDYKADGIVVHHGLFWRGQDGRVVGWMRDRLKLLLTHDINLWAYQRTPCYFDNWRCAREVPYGEPSPCIAAVTLEMVLRKLQSLITYLRKSAPYPREKFKARF